MVEQGCADDLGGTGDHVQHSGGQSGTLGQHRQRQRREWRLRRRLDDHRTTSSQRCTRLAGNHRRRKIPRCDRRAHPDRLLEHQNALIGLWRGNGVAIDALALLGEPFEKAGGVGDLAARLGQRLALLAGHQIGQILLMGVQQLEPAAQDHGARLGGLRPPARQCSSSSGNGAPGFIRATGRHLTESLAAGRIVNGQSGAVRGADPATVHIAVFPEQARVAQLHDRLQSMKAAIAGAASFGILRTR